MKIKEIETESGMSRANIRFYEAEGLLNPERSENGYREYSENDLEILKRVKLLRSLHISLEEIKSLHTGEQALVETLNRHLAKLQGERAELEQALKICKTMCSDGVQYQTLDAQHYLDAIEQSTRQPVLTPPSDVISEVRIPWRRFFARFLDFAIYSTLWNVFLALNTGISVRSRGNSILSEVVVLLIMLFLEPVFLALFGTTPGKWVLGIHVTNNEGKRMSYSNAWNRTWTMLLRGMGLGIPIYHLVRLWKSYQANDTGETLDWEYHSTITLKDEKIWRLFAYLGVHAALIGVLALAPAMAEMPKNRGEITVAEFCENYNRLADYYGLTADGYLDTQGNRVRDERSENIVYIGNQDIPVFLFEETDGLMTGMHFSVNMQDGEGIITGQQDEMILSILAFAGAQNGNNPFSNDIRKIVEDISESPFESYSFSVYGVNITCDVVYSGYNDSTLGMLFPEEDAETSYSLSFSMQKESTG